MIVVSIRTGRFNIEDNLFTMIVVSICTGRFSIEDNLFTMTVAVSTSIYTTLTHWFF